MNMRPFTRLYAAWSSWQEELASEALETKIFASESRFDRGYHLSAARLAVECGEAGAPRLVGCIRRILKNANFHQPVVIDTCLVALQKQGLRAADALGEITDLLSYRRGLDDKASQQIRERTIETLNVIGNQVLYNLYDWYLPQLDRAMPRLLNIHEKFGHTLSLRIKVFGELGEIAIRLHKEPVENFVLEHLGDVREQTKTALSGDVRRQAVVTMEILDRALRDISDARKLSAHCQPQ